MMAVKGHKAWNKGLKNHLLKETKDKMSKAKKGKTWEKIMGKEKAELRTKKARIRKTKPETKQKQSKKMKEYYKNHPEAKERLRNIWKGKTHSQETKEQLRKLRLGEKNGMFGRHWSKEERLKMSLQRRGKKSYRYKGNSKIKELIRGGFRYRDWREKVFKRDGYTCQVCYQVGKEINAHHKFPFNRIIDEYNIKNLEEADNCKLLWDINNGVTLCKRCHTKRGIHKE